MLHASSGISSAAHHNPHINAFVVYARTISFYESQTTIGPANYHYYSQYSTSFSESFIPYEEIPKTKGKYPIFIINAKSQQLIKHAKISYFIGLFVFRKFSCGTYRNGLNRDASKLKYSMNLEKYEPSWFDTFCGESSF